MRIFRDRLHGTLARIFGYLAKNLFRKINNKSNLLIYGNRLDSRISMSLKKMSQLKCKVKANNRESVNFRKKH
jgi:hypothetical protein